MKNDKPTIEDKLLQAFYDFNLTKSNHNWAKDELFSAELAYHTAQKEYDQTFYEYVKHGTREYLQLHEIARVKLENACKQSFQAKSRLKIALCKFRRAEKLYNKLQKRANKNKPETQPGK